MKALRVHSYGQPPRLDEVPEPQVTGPDDAIVRIGGAGLCHTDLHIIDGWLAGVIPAELPLVLGHENAGWVHPAGRRPGTWRPATRSSATRASPAACARPAARGTTCGAQPALP